MPDGIDDSAMIALLPVVGDWSTLEMPHLTLASAGKIEDLSPNAFNSMCKDAAAVAQLARIITLRVISTEVFGLFEKVDVYRLRNTPELMAIQRSVNRWSRSEFPFNPHVTIGPAGDMPPGINPGYITFDRICVCYGEDMMTFWLKN